MSEKAIAPEEQYWTLRLEGAARALAANNFGVSVHATAGEAAGHLVNGMLGDSWRGTVNFGGSVSVLQSGVVDLLLNHPGADVIDTYDFNKDPAIRAKLRREHYICDLYLCSSNAVTMAGQLMNVDGLGNRVASMAYGPAKVALFVGRNKLCATLEEARDRCSNMASPMNNIRIGYPNPCTKTARCMDCNSPKRICNYWSIIEKSSPPERIHVLLINQDLGF
ncbi:MAG: lactate utilization protein [Desulfobulbus sp.]|nr:lactate utilization protein [Desulfobulbus sp.]